MFISIYKNIYFLIYPSQILTHFLIAINIFLLSFFY